MHGSTGPQVFEEPSMVSRIRDREEVMMMHEAGERSKLGIGKTAQRAASWALLNAFEDDLPLLCTYKTK
jgi:hypothetical protein